jgi:hypothetical protein
MPLTAIAELPAFCMCKQTMHQATMSPMLRATALRPNIHLTHTAGCPSNGMSQPWLTPGLLVSPVHCISLHGTWTALLRHAPSKCAQHLSNAQGYHGSEDFRTETSRKHAYVIPCGVGSVQLPAHAYWRAAGLPHVPHSVQRAH